MYFFEMLLQMMAKLNKITFVGTTLNSKSIPTRFAEKT